MEYRSQARLIAALFLAAAAQAQPFRFEVRHERLLKDHAGVVTFDDNGVQFQNTRWGYGDLRQVWLSPEKLVLVTYQDRKWLLGIDREFEFYLTGNTPPVQAAYDFLKTKLDQRFVAALAEPSFQPEWEIPVKLLGTLQGSEGRLRVGDDRLIYETARRGQSRTWRLEDIENVTSTGPFEITLTTHERAIAQYGGMRAFHFQTKQRVDPKRIDALWKRLNRDQGLEFLTAISEGRQTPQ